MSYQNDDFFTENSTTPLKVSPYIRDIGVVPTEGFYARHVKAKLDIILVLIASPIWITLVAISALLIMISGHAPFYSQSRVGLGGRVFTIYKLRSMLPDADNLLEEHLENDSAARIQWERDQKLKDDPRITTIGRIIRKTSIDEMPQFLNVLKGDMSIVGPRPFMVEQRPLYSGTRYFDMRPGLTGLWQISSRNDVEFLSRVQFDDLYARSLSLGSDLRIMAKTLMVILRGTGC